MDVDRVLRLIQDIEDVLKIISEIVGRDFGDFIGDVRSRYA